jgi:DNA-binding LacI/PurR family transcriptional regulator
MIVPRVTLKDVAARAGVSYQTVSKVLNQKASVAPETEARIWQVVRELDYRPNISARNLRSMSSNLIGYAWRQTSDQMPRPILDQFLYWAAETAELNHYHLLTFLVASDDSLDVRPYQDLYSRRQVEGYLLADTIYDDPRIAYLIDSGIPFVSFGRANEDWRHCWVDVDGRFGMGAVVDHLVSRGHRRLALVTWPEGSRTGRDREDGYRDGLERAGIAYDSALLVRVVNSLEAGMNAFSRLFSLPPSSRPTAVACVSDYLAIGVMRAATINKVTVGRDLAVTGYDDTYMAECAYPSLTSIRQPIREVGVQIIKLLLKQINFGQLCDEGLLLRPELVIRDTS